MLDQPATLLATITTVRPHVTVIHNSTCGRRNDRDLKRFIQSATTLGLAVNVQITGGAGDAESMAAEAAADAWADVLVVAGGDGTINEVVNGLAGAASPPALALLPLGTANVLAAEIGTADSAAHLVDDIVRAAGIEGPNAQIYVARANGRRFTMMAGVGFDAHVVAAVDWRTKQLFGKVAYLVAFARALFTFGERRYRVFIDGVAYEAASAVIANGHFYGGRFSCTPDARLDDPELHVCLFLRSGRWSILCYGVALLYGRLHRRADVRIVRGREVRVEGMEGEPVQCDGDVAAMLPLDVHATGERLQLVVPAVAKAPPHAELSDRR